jgi:phosphopantothenoylcysteine decarboxylase / phosphopantothenate---cysteine ligase
MGIALATAAARRGAEVVLIAANVALPAPSGVRRIDVETAEQLAEVARTEFSSAHVLLMAAAPADFRAAEVAAGKMQRK